MDAADVARVTIYRSFLETGHPPAVEEELATALQCDSAEAERQLNLLADAHTVVLAPGTRSIWMAHPFSATPTPYRVSSAGKSYWANCAWDAFGIAALVERDTECIARCPDCLESIDLSVRGGSVGVGIVHFAVPPRHFWDNVAYT